MHKVNFKNSAIVRVATLYSGLFAVGLIILLAALLWLVTENVWIQNREDIEQDSRTLANVLKNDGEATLVSSIRILTKNVERKRAIYVLQSSTQELIAGSAIRFEPFEGWRKLTVTFAADNKANYVVFGQRLGDSYLFVGRRTRNVWTAQRIILVAFLWALCLVIPLTIWGGIALARNAFRRIGTFDSVARAFVAGDFTQRVPITKRHDELDHLAGSINQVLQQIEKLLTSLKQVTNDVAHDLRTPLGHLQQRLADARDNEARGVSNISLLDETQEDIEGIIGTFDALLQIAALDAKTWSTKLTEIDLAEVGQAIFETYENVADDNGRKLTIRKDGAPLISGEIYLVKQLLVNLVENAIVHTPAGSTIGIDILTSGGHPTLIVSDDGPGIPAKDREHVLERFVRLEASRTTPGSGLGLTTVKAIASLHGATLTLSDNNPGLMVKIRFPVSDDVHP